MSQVDRVVVMSQVDRVVVMSQVDRAVIMSVSRSSSSNVTSRSSSSNVTSRSSSSNVTSRSSSSNVTSNTNKGHKRSERGNNGSTEVRTNYAKNNNDGIRSTCKNVNFVYCVIQMRLFCIHSVSSGLFYEGANYMIIGLPEISTFPS